MQRMSEMNQIGMRQSGIYQQRDECQKKASVERSESLNRRYVEDKQFNHQQHQRCQADNQSPDQQRYSTIQEEKVFNNRGIRNQSYHQEQTNKVRSRLEQSKQFDQMYNYNGEQSHREQRRSLDGIQNGLQKHRIRMNSQGRYSQPFGSGIYTNQLAQRMGLSKTAVNFNIIRGLSSHRPLGSTQPSSHQNSSSSIFASMKQSQVDQNKLRGKLYFDERTKTIPKTTIKNTIIEDIVTEGDVFIGNKKLMNSIFKLKSLNLLKQHESHVNRYKGIGNLPFVYNDYHTKSTNNGYSRQEKGGFCFTR